MRGVLGRGYDRWKSEPRGDHYIENLYGIIGKTEGEKENCQ